jgi:hypothetical protein
VRRQAAQSNIRAEAICYGTRMEYEGVSGMQRDCWLLGDIECHCASHGIHDLNHTRRTR